ncbi:uncharacterized protein BYT42DRAFT_578217 [Radiomyces spectabilis]|uniref:uncharacterized protein n=1 Tax=Radiomyces spectabilis TaxID=64574 RepID=UPI00221F2CDF|nr:uncharacterized protein BYT42DRAFT_578217 [Radiomyces spectabilis]KAI8372846.1 hypothetical protein BYT42DRAFT_578217 [Radiomyces spectabilis]
MIGPSIPEHLLKAKQRQSEESEEETSVAPSQNDIGPYIPSHLIEKKRQGDTENNEEDQAHSPPRSPPAADNANDDDDDADADAYVPALPPDLLEERKKAAPSSGKEGRRRRPVGPTMPTAWDAAAYAQQEDEDDIVGPKLPSSDDNDAAGGIQSTIAEIEERARRSKELLEQKASGVSEKVERPEWMLVPPELDYLKTADSSRSRTFSNKIMDASDRDTSVWTETPAERLKRQQEEVLGKRKKAPTRAPPSMQDIETRRNLEEYNKTKRAESLMDMHRKKAKSSKGKEDVSKRPFDREKDLLGSKPMDRRTKNELLKRSTELGSRFGSGSRSFL